MNKPTKEQVENRTSDYVCSDCGIGFLEKGAENHVATFHLSKCGICNEPSAVTHIRNYNYLNQQK